ncbi:MAG UNVERIFIED_CONTAM: hypothetical protein LVR18_21160 [Planctomycetaceae bacterium]
MGAVVQTALARLQATFDEQLQSLLTARWTTNSAIPLLGLETLHPPTTLTPSNSPGSTTVVPERPFN